MTNLEQKQEAMRQHWEPRKRARNRTLAAQTELLSSVPQTQST